MKNNIEPTFPPTYINGTVPPSLVIGLVNELLDFLADRPELLESGVRLSEVRRSNAHGDEEAVRDA